MHVGMSIFFQNLTGLEDQEVYQHELAMMNMAQELGFDSVWSAEHHFDHYTMAPSVSQLLTYAAARMERVNVGSMVMVLPWHDPVRIVEEIAVLEHLSGGRTILGIGRGLGRLEFEGLRIKMGESRERFVEYAEAVLNALETGVLEYDGKHYKQHPVNIRARPFKSFKGRVYASAVSPESARIMARLGIGIMVIAQKPWDKTVAEIESYRELYRELNNGEAPPKPLMVSFVACHEDAGKAQEMHLNYTHAYSRSALAHYEFHNEGLANIPGYEYYGALAKNIKKHGTERFVSFLADLQVRGTPDEVFEQMMEIREKIDAGGFINVFSFGGMPHDLAKENARLFARKVLPRLKALDVGPPLGQAPSLAMPIN